MALFNKYDLDVQHLSNIHCHANLCKLALNTQSYWDWWVLFDMVINLRIEKEYSDLTSKVMSKSLQLILRRTWMSSVQQLLTYFSHNCHPHNCATNTFVSQCTRKSKAKFVQTSRTELNAQTACRRKRASVLREKYCKYCTKWWFASGGSWAV